MKRIETSRFRCNLSSLTIESILYTLNEKDWDSPIYTITISCPGLIYSIYLEWKGLRLNWYHFMLILLKLIIYSIYLEWKGLRLFWCLFSRFNSSSSLFLSILYTLNEKDWDVKLSFNVIPLAKQICSIYSIYLEWKGLRLRISSIQLLR